MTKQDNTALTEALECEIAEYLAKYESIRDEQGHKQVVCNGHCKERNILTGVGEIEIQQPRVRDKRDENEREKFTSKILPPYLRKAKTQKATILTNSGHFMSIQTPSTLSCRFKSVSGLTYFAASIVLSSCRSHAPF